MERTTVIFALSLLSLLATCQAVHFSDCGSTKGQFSSVTLSGCDMQKPVCELIRQTNATITIDFTTNESVTGVTAVVHGIIMGRIPVPFPLPNPNVCTDENSGIKCPLKSGGSYNYHASLPILKSYPKLSVVVKWELRDEANENIVCVIIPAKIK